MHTADFATSCVLWHELLSTKNQHFAGTYSSCGFGGGFSVVAVIAYCLPWWRASAWAIGTFQVILLPIFFWLPESPKWLREKGRFEEARDIEYRIDQFNGTVSATVNDEAKTLSNDSQSSIGSSEKVDEKSQTILFKNKILRTRLVLMMICWPVISTLYVIF